MKNKHKTLQGIIKLWCFTKWENCDIICADESSIHSADVIAVVGNNKIGFIFTIGKTTDFIKQQIINCRKMCNKIYLIANFADINAIHKSKSDIGLLNVSNKYGLGNIIEELQF